jgi:hypothetical protein
VDGACAYVERNLRQRLHPGELHRNEIESESGSVGHDNYAEVITTDI